MFPQNPYDGLTTTITYPNGDSLEFTYSSQFNVWLMPEVQILRDRGYTLTIPSHPQFNGEILTAFVLPALAEPTFVGEILVGGAAIYVTTLYAYQWATYYNNTMYREMNHEYCVNLYQVCVTYKPYLPCGICLQFCEVQEDWDEFNCPDVIIR